MQVVEKVEGLSSDRLAMSTLPGVSAGRAMPL